MKRWIAAFTLFALLLALAGCGAAPIPAEEGRPSAVPAPARSAPAPTAAPLPADTEPSSVPTSAAEPLPAEKASAPTELARAVYPETAPYPGVSPQAEEGDWAAWRADLEARRLPDGYADGLEPWLKACLTEFLAGDGDRNLVCAPMNLYMTLAMLAELTDGESRAQILSLLGADGLDALRAKADALWNAAYRDDGLVTCRLAASLWLNHKIGFVRETMDRLAETYHASSFRGVMGSEELDQALRDWLNEQTGDLLKEQTAGLHLDPETVMAVASTVYFKAAWSNKFSRELTAPQLFHAEAGDRETDFLHRSWFGDYFWGEGFSAVPVPMENGGHMWFILPEEGKTPADLLSGEALDFLLSRNRFTREQRRQLTIHFAAPRFDVSSDIGLIPGLQELGLRDVFDPEVSDFTPMTGDTDRIFISQAQHAARVMIDEDGCTGAAFTILAPAAAAMIVPREEISFTADRPFLFLVTDQDGLPQFAGVVNRVD